MVTSRKRFSRRPKRRFTKRTRKFTKKRANTRSTSNMTKVKGAYIGKNAMVKVSYRKDFDAAVTSSDNWTTPNVYGKFFPVTSTPSSIVFAGASCCTPLGNPQLAGPEQYPLGLPEWGDFYSRAICFGSSIKIQVMPLGVSSLRYVLIKLANQYGADKYAPNLNSENSLKTQVLDGLDYPSLCAYPGAKYGYIRNADSGVTRINGAFQSTKSILGIKDLKDNQEALEMDLPSAVGDGDGRNSSGQNEDDQGFIWYFRIFSSSSETSAVCQFMVTMKYYLQLIDRKQQIQNNTPSVTP